MRMPRCVCSSIVGSLTGSLVSATLVSACASASEVTTSSRLYDITVETGMPHLEENLRYAITLEQRCLNSREIFSVFPILDHKSLNGCRLGDERRGDGTSSWTLVCEGKQGTTGHALWSLDARQISGTLNVKLGGKNMTFYQRVTLRPAGECPELTFSQVGVPCPCPRHAAT